MGVLFSLKVLIHEYVKVTYLNYKKNFRKKESTPFSSSQRLKNFLLFDYLTSHMINVCLHLSPFNARIIVITINIARKNNLKNKATLCTKISIISILNIYFIVSTFILLAIFVSSITKELILSIFERRY